MTRLHPSLLLGLAVLGAASEARAQHVDLRARTVYHGYQLQLDPYGSGTQQRELHRFYGAVEGGAYGLGPTRKFDLVASFRYDTDFGRGFGVDTPFGGGLTSTGDNDIDLIMLYVDWRGMIGDEFDLRVGRQMQLDDLDWYVFDGIKLIGHLWRDGENKLEVDAYAGLPVRFDALFSSGDALIGDGTEVYDGEDPFGGIAGGINAYARLFRDLSISLSWRNEIVFREPLLEGYGPSVVAEGDARGEVIGGSDRERNLAALASAGSTGVQESLFGGSIGYTLRPLDLSAQASIVWNALTSNLDRGRAALAWDPARNLHFGLEYLRIRPRFVGDSIFNWFNIFPYDRGRFEGSWSLLDRRLTLSAAYFLQTFHGGPSVSGSEFLGEDTSHGPSGGLTWRDQRFGLSIYAEGGTNFGGAYAYGGNYSLAHLSADVGFFARRLVLDGRVSVTTVQDDQFEGIDDGGVAEPRTTLSLAVGISAELLDWLRARALYVQNVDPILEGNYRVFTELAVLYR